MATTKAGSVHIERVCEFSKSAVIASTAISAAKRYRIKFHPLGEIAARIETGCGDFADELRQGGVIRARSSTVHVENAALSIQTVPAHPDAARNDAADAAKAKAAGAPLIRWCRLLESVYA
jgi:hypothetical protein